MGQPKRGHIRDQVVEPDHQWARDGLGQAHGALGQGRHPAAIFSFITEALPGDFAHSVHRPLKTDLGRRIVGDHRLNQVFQAAAEVGQYIAQDVDERLTLIGVARAFAVALRRDLSLQGKQRFVLFSPHQ